MSEATKSKVEGEFEKWCEKNSDWFYKNGDKGNDYFSILYTNEYGKQKLFYPDYILSVHNEIWIIETKGGITYSGADANIDDFSEKKFNALKEYVAKYNMRGGFIVLDEDGLDDELCISTSIFNRIKDKYELIGVIIEFSQDTTLPWTTFRKYYSQAYLRMLTEFKGE